jgi:hypothetical protein
MATKRPSRRRQAGVCGRPVRGRRAGWRRPLKRSRAGWVRGPSGGVTDAHRWGAKATGLFATSVTPRHPAVGRRRGGSAWTPVTSGDGAASPRVGAGTRGALWGIPRQRLTHGAQAWGPTCTTARRRERRGRRAEGSTALTRATAAARSGHGGERLTPGGARGSCPASRRTVRRARPSSATTGASGRGEGSACGARSRRPRRCCGRACWPGRAAAPTGGAPACHAGNGPS